MADRVRQVVKQTRARIFEGLTRVNQAKNGQPLGRANKVVLADGTTLGEGFTYAGGNRPSQCDKDFGPGGHESEACRPDGRKTTNKQ